MKRREKGLTLIELMVTLAVAIVLLAIGIPAYRSLDVNDRLAAQVNSIVGSLNQARLEAISAGVPVAVCAASSKAANTCAGSTNWANGWLVFQDGGSTPGAFDSGENLLRRAPPLSGSPLLADAVAFVRFDGKGERVDLDPKKSNKDLNLVVLKLNQTGTTAGRDRWVCVNRAGQIRTEAKDLGSEQCH
jgi:type IV fimbrial biogenesis protein FimT